MKLLLLFLLVFGSRQANHTKFVAHDQTAQADLTSIGISMEQYKLLGGIYPSTEQGISALFKKPKVAPLPRRWVQSLAEIPVDPWGRPYQYKLVKGKFTLWSTGPDVKKAEDDLLYVVPKKEGIGGE